MSTSNFSCPDSPEDFTGFPPGRFEPAADTRATALHVFQFFVSLTQNGFTEHQALELVKVVIQTATQHGLNANNPDNGSNG